MARKRKFTKEEELQICDIYDYGFNSYELAKIWSCDPTTVVSIIKGNGYTLKKLKERMTGKNNPAKRPEVREKMRASHKIFSNKQELQICRQYTEENLITYDLAKIHGCTSETIGNIVRRNGYVLRTRSKAREGMHLSKKVKRKISDSECKTRRKQMIENPKFLQKVLKNNLGTKCYYDSEFFPSLGERDCYIYLNNLNYLIIHNWLGRFDFLVNGKIVVEFHPYDRNGLTGRQYYNQRRKLLNEYGYKDLKLVVIKNLKEIENKLEK